MTKLEQAMTEQLDSMIGKPEPCEWCSGESYETSAYGTVRITGSQFSVFLDDQDIHWISDSFQINYCPNCGRDLREVTVHG